jgi:hypothetical protein
MTFTRLTRVRYFAAAAIIVSAAITAPAQSTPITVTLLPSFAATRTQNGNPDPALKNIKNLSVISVTALGVTNFQPAYSWLYFNAGALPKGVEIKSAELLLVRGGGDRGMLIRVASVKASPSGDQPGVWSDNGGTPVKTFQSDLPQGAQPATDFATWNPNKDLVQADGDRRYIGLLLTAQGSSAGRRIYYGLRQPGAVDSDAYLQPRLILTYQMNPPAAPACAGDASPLALIQSDGRLASRSSCRFVPSPNDPPQSDYAPEPVAAGTLTRAPVVYGDLLYVVRKYGSETRLEALGPLGAPIWSTRLGGDVSKGAPMVVDRFGRLRIITGDTIFTCLLNDNNAHTVDKKAFAFGSAPDAVVPGPDGTLYIVKNEGIFALNPEVGTLEAGRVVPSKLWQVTSSVLAKITLSPDARFVYALAGDKDGRSVLLAINAQTGTDVRLPAALNFPGDLKTFRNPVVVKAPGPEGADYVFIAGDSGSKPTVWGVKNTPRSRDGDTVAQLTGQWEYPADANNGIGQPVLDSTTAADLAEPSQLRRFDAGLSFVFNKGAPKVSTTF